MEINEEIQKAFEVLKEGGIILYPTDTVLMPQTRKLLLRYTNSNKEPKPKA
jgi:hypothetical protein